MKMQLGGAGGSTSSAASRTAASSSTTRTPGPRRELSSSTTTANARAAAPARIATCGENENEEASSSMAALLYSAKGALLLEASSTSARTLVTSSPAAGGHDDDEALLTSGSSAAATAEVEQKDHYPPNTSLSTTTGENTTSAGGALKIIPSAPALTIFTAPKLQIPQAKKPVLSGSPLFPTTALHQEGTTSCGAEGKDGGTTTRALTSLSAASSTSGLVGRSANYLGDERGLSSKNSKTSTSFSAEGSALLAPPPVSRSTSVRSPKMLFPTKAAATAVPVGKKLLLNNFSGTSTAPSPMGGTTTIGLLEDPSAGRSSTWKTMSSVVLAPSLLAQGQQGQGDVALRSAAPTSTRATGVLIKSTTSVEKNTTSIPAVVRTTPISDQRDEVAVPAAAVHTTTSTPPSTFDDAARRAAALDKATNNFRQPSEMMFHSSDEDDEDDDEIPSITLGGKPKELLRHAHDTKHGGTQKQGRRTKINSTSRSRSTSRSPTKQEFEIFRNLPRSLSFNYAGGGSGAATTTGKTVHGGAGGVSAAAASSAASTFAGGGSCALSTAAVTTPRTLGMKNMKKQAAAANHGSLTMNTMDVAGSSASATLSGGVADHVPTAGADVNKTELAPGPSSTGEPPGGPRPSAPRRSAVQAEGARLGGTSKNAASSCTNSRVPSRRATLTAYYGLNNRSKVPSRAAGGATSTSTTFDATSPSGTGAAASSTDSTAGAVPAGVVRKMSGATTTRVAGTSPSLSTSPYKKLVLAAVPTSSTCISSSRGRISRDSGAQTCSSATTSKVTRAASGSTSTATPSSTSFVSNTANRAAVRRRLSAVQRRQSVPTEQIASTTVSMSSHSTTRAGRAPPTSSRQQGAVVSTSWNSTATASQRRAPKHQGVEVVEIRTTMSAAGGPKIESPEQEEEGEGENKAGGSAEAVPACVRQSDHHREVDVLPTAVASDIDAPFDAGADPSIDGNYTPATVAGDEDDHPVQLQPVEPIPSPLGGETSCSDADSA
ncbi:unnamed protein product [Amoebophrya sp. A120]|nr:unnamed protein product [Amoebophrya sp. A120]|eukprot:GSA120T00010060001.1